MKHSWIPWTVVGFTEADQEDLRKNPIKATCGTCGKDLTGKETGDMNCNKENCPDNDGGW